MGVRSTAGKEASLAFRYFHTLLKKADCTFSLFSLQLLHHLLVRGNIPVELEAFARVGMEYPHLPPEWKLRWRTYGGKRGWGPHSAGPAIAAEAHSTALAAVAKAIPCDNQLKVLPRRKRGW